MNSAGQIASAGFPLTGSLYFCSLCGKPFDQENSHRRHLKYCRRRVALKQPARPRACQPCSQSKNKCNFKSPCSRCATRGFLCSYGKDQPLSAHLATADPFNVGSSVEGNPCVSRVPGVEPLSPWQPETQPFSLDDFFGSSAFPACSASAVDMGLSSEKDSIPLWIHGSEHLEDPDGVLRTLPRIGCQNQPETAIDLSSRALFADSLLRNVDQPSHPYNFPAGSRQQILSLMRAFPRMVNRPNGLPPYIHPLGCGRHFRPRNAEAADRPDPATFVPLPTFAACMSIAHVFLARNAATDEFLWRTVENERREIAARMDSLSPGETLVAIQSIVIYVVMWIIRSGSPSMVTHHEMITTMRRLSAHFCRVHLGPFAPPHRRLTRPSWEEWIFEETRRRITITCFLLALATNPEPCTLLADPHLTPLPGSKAMWEARSRREWEHEYDVYLADCQGARIRLETVGDLSLAKMENKEGGLAEFDNDGGQVDDALDSWYAGADSLSLVLATIVPAI